jgi:uncharacterized Fe-S cluster-containing protein
MHSDTYSLSYRYLEWGNPVINFAEIIREGFFWIKTITILASCWHYFDLKMENSNIYIEIVNVFFTIFEIFYPFKINCFMIQDKNDL